MTQVLIIGGGFAGLSAGVALADQGARVTVIEQRRILGGRAYSVEDGTTGELIDNGQHALLGAFHETQKFLKTIGTDGLIRYQDRFRMVLAEPGGGRMTLKAASLPAPFHLAAGVALCRGLSMTDRFHLLRAGLSMLMTRSLPETMTLKDWLDSLGQPASLRQRWWYPLSISALNELPHRASADLFLCVLKQAYFGSVRDSSFGIMTVGLGDLYTEQARQFIEAGGGQVLCNTTAFQLAFSDRQLDAVVLRNSGSMTADYMISAVPHHVLRKLLPPELMKQGAPFEALTHLAESPMVSIHLWFDRPVMDEEFIGLIDSPIQWVFDKSRLWKEGETQAGALACITSGAYDLIDRSKEDLIALAQNELVRFFPEVSKARLIHSRLIKERNATYSCTPEAERWRPKQETPYRNFFLAGDWTRTGLPATIEGAVTSGHRCAGLILRDKSGN
ncbi:MAG: FAD-dependent oxidoreductase [Nitrospirae bacterium]|nr:FAD-dependent oxidoreductase [Nitrospirota bacterium]